MRHRSLRPLGLLALAALLVIGIAHRARAVPGFDSLWPANGYGNVTVSLISSTAAGATYRVSVTNTQPAAGLGIKGVLIYAPIAATSMSQPPNTQTQLNGANGVTAWWDINGSADNNGNGLPDNYIEPGESVTDDTFTITFPQKINTSTLGLALHVVRPYSGCTYFAKAGPGSSIRARLLLIVDDCDSVCVASGAVTTLVYKICNTGTDTLTKITITDAFGIMSAASVPASLAPGQCVAVNRTVRISTPPGTTTINDQVVVTAFDAAIIQTISSAGLQPDIITLNDAHPSLAISYTASPTLVSPGGTATLSAKVTNTGDVTISNITVVDSVYGTIGTIPSLAPGASATVTKMVTVQKTTTSTATATGTDTCAGATVTITSLPVTITTKCTPTITCPPDVSANNDPSKCSASGVTLGTPTVSGNCPRATVTNNAPSTFPVGTTTVTWTVTDSLGDTASCPQKVTVTDTEKPKITCPTVAPVCNDKGKCSAVVSFTASATDNCAGVGSVSYSQNPGTAFPVGTTMVTATVSDAAGNTNNCTFPVTVNDCEKPTITCPTVAPVCNDKGKCSAVVTFSATATDNCSGIGAVSYSQNPGTAFPVGTTMVTATVADAAGNTTTCTFPVTVNDCEKPTINCPTVAPVCNDTGKCSAVVNFTATASDNCQGVGSVSYSQNPGTPFPVGTTMVTATVADAAGNINSCTFPVIVNDCEKPKITCPTVTPVCNDTGKCSAVVSFTAIATDNCPGVGSVSYSQNPGTAFPVGTTMVTATVSDAAGNMNSCTFPVTVNDCEKPTITCPTVAPVCNDAGKCSAVVSFTATASDNCPGVGSVSYSQDPGTAFPVGTTMVTATVSDAAGNTNNCTFAVTVNDCEKPTITCPTVAPVCNDKGKCSAVVSFTATASDNCPGVGSVSYSQNPGTAFPVGTTMVTATVSDAAGNTNTCTFAVTVNDCEKPTITCPGDISTCVPSGQTSAQVNPGTATASDNCKVVSVSGVRSDGQPLSASYPLGTTTITWTAVDSGQPPNSATCVQTITVTTCAMIRGQVTCTESNGGIAGATVLLLQNGQAVQTANTDAKGNYQFPDVQDGSYSVQALATDFASNTSAPFAFSRMGPNDAIENVALTPLPIQYEAVLKFSGRVFFSATSGFSSIQALSGGQPVILNGPGTDTVDLTSPAAAFGDLANGGFASPGFTTSYRYFGYIPGFPGLGKFDAGHALWVIMESPLVSGGIWDATTDSFRNFVYVRDGIFNGGTNDTYFIRFLFSHPFDTSAVVNNVLTPTGTARQYTITGLDLNPPGTTGTPGVIGSVGWVRDPSVQWTNPAGPAPPAGDTTDIPPGWMAQTRFQFQQATNKGFHFNATGTYADVCGTLFNFSIHPEADPSPGDDPAAEAAVRRPDGGGAAPGPSPR